LTGAFLGAVRRGARAVEAIGRILNLPILGELHHQYCRI
jgi:hypothetical protein